MKKIFLISLIIGIIVFIGIIYAEIKLSQNISDKVPEKSKTSNIMQKDREASIEALYEDKLNQYKEELKKNPKDGKIYNKIGLLYAKNGLYEKALKMFEESLKLNEQIGVYANIGNIYAMLEKYDIAIKKYESALTLKSADKNKADIYYNLGMVYYNKGEFGKTKEMMKKAVELNEGYREKLASLEKEIGSKDITKADKKVIKDFKWME